MQIRLPYQGLQIGRWDLLCAIYNQTLYDRVMLCHLPYSSIRNIYTTAVCSFPHLLNFLGPEEPLWNSTAVLSQSSLQVSGHPGNPSETLLFSLMLAVISSKQSHLVWWCVCLVSLLSHGSEPLHYCCFIFHTGLPLNHFASRISKRAIYKIHITLCKLEFASPPEQMERCGNCQRATLPTKIQSS